MTTDILLRPVKIGLVNILAYFLYQQIPVSIKLQAWKVAPSYWQYIDAFLIGFLGCLIAGVLGAYGEPFLIDII